MQQFVTMSLDLFLASTSYEEARRHVNAVRFDWVIRKLQGAPLQSVLNSLVEKHSLTSNLEALYFIRAGLEKRPSCANCGKGVRFENGWRTYCSKKCASQHPNTLAKRKATTLDRYGVEHFRNHEACATTSWLRYGTEFPMQAESILEKRKTTVRDRYGVDSVLSGGSSVRNQIVYEVPYRKISKTLTNLATDYDITPLFSVSEYVVGEGRFTRYLFKHNKCGKTFKSLLHNAKFGCKKCFPKYQSAQERLIISWLEEAGIEVEPLDRKILKPLEIDIWVPKSKIGIEVNGIYFHSTQRGTQKRYHLEKTTRAESQGFSLLHFFSNEIAQKPAIVRSMILAKLGISRKIAARKCAIKQIRSSEATAFFNRTHLQGGCRAKTCIGLFYEDELVAAAAYGAARIVNNSIELLRFSSELNTIVVGGFSKLQHYFEASLSPGTNLISYADRRWSSGNLYKQTGWQLTNVNSPVAWYFNPGESDLTVKLHHRTAFQKFKSMAKLKLTSSEKTNEELAEELRFWNIFDCGTLTFKRKIV